LFGMMVATGGEPACIALAAHPEGGVVAQFDVPAAAPWFTVAYVHSVTRTPVVERYRVDNGTIVQTEIRFAQHGPGLPTQADTGGAFERRDGQFVVTMARRFPVVVMRVHAGPVAAAHRRRRERGPRGVGQPRARAVRGARPLPRFLTADDDHAQSPRRHADRHHRGGLGGEAGRADPPVRHRVELPQARRSGRPAGDDDGVVLSGFHIYTAGFGLLVEIKHRAFHLALVLGLIFLVFPRPRLPAGARSPPRGLGLEPSCSARSTSTSHGTWSTASATRRGRHGWAFLALVGFVAVLSLPLPPFGGYRRQGSRGSTGRWRSSRPRVSLYQLVFFDDVFVRRVGARSRRTT
jgi:hypothetical protein